MILLLSLQATPTFAQNDDFVKQFQQARQGMMDDYNKFRNTILTDYDKYMQGVWKEYKKFKGDIRSQVPKPKTPPTYTEPKQPEKPVTVKPKMPVSPIAPKVRPTIDPVNKPKLPEVKPDIPDIDYTGSGIELPLMPAVSAIPVMPALPNIGHVKVPVSKQTIDVDYYGENIQFQKAILLAKKDIASINAVMPNASQNEKIVAAQYVLVNCGYNIRLGMNDHQVAMLVPYAEHVFEKSYINIDGKKYYIYPNIDDSGAFRTCDLPKDAELGKDMELRFTGKTVIGSGTKPFSYEAAGITLKGEVPTGIMPLLDEYPVIDIPTVASSVVDKKFRNEVVEQIRTQVAGLDEQDAANRILRFIQKGFPYATDDEQFKREKYLYFEETLYYPLCDCEDRAIFYAYLVHEILGLDVHLIQFPGHECTAVAFNQPVANGTSYEYKGKTYYICDPTYIGARIGRCMPSYAKESPQIEVWY